MTRSIHALRLRFGRLCARPTPWTGAALAAGLLLAGCGEQDGGRNAAGNCGGAKCDAVDGETDGGTLAEHPEHREAILACEGAAERLRSHTYDERWDARQSIERTRTSCLAAANDAIVPVIDVRVAARDEALAGHLAQEVDRYRTARGLVCTTLVEASVHAVAKSGAVAQAACAAQSELDLGALVDAYADLGVTAATLPESRVRYPECWTAFDDAGLAAAVASQTREATEDLLACIGDRNEDARVALVDKIQAQFPGRASKTLEDDTVRALRSHENAVGGVCEALAVAGPTVDDAEVALDNLQCQIRGVSMVGHLGDKLVPGVWPQGAEGQDPMAEEPGDSSGGDSSGGDGSGDGGSTGG